VTPDALRSSCQGDVLPFIQHAQKLVCLGKRFDVFGDIKGEKISLTGQLGAMTSSRLTPHVSGCKRTLVESLILKAQSISWGAFQDFFSDIAADREVDALSSHSNVIVQIRVGSPQTSIRASWLDIRSSCIVVQPRRW
jgi:hypothetical protein